MRGKLLLVDLIFILMPGEADFGADENLPFWENKKDRRMKTEGGNRSRVQKQQLEILITTFHPGKDIRVDMTPTK